MLTVSVAHALGSGGGEAAIVAGLIAVAGVYWNGASSLPVRRRRLTPAVVAWVVVAIALVSPLDELAGDSMAAHMTQHLLLTLVASPLLVAGRVGRRLLLGLPARVRAPAARTGHRLRRLRAPAWMWVLYTGWLWWWHAAAGYEMALHSNVVHAIQHAGYLLAGLGFWSTVAVFDRIGRQGNAVLFVFTTALAGTVLAALMTFSPEAWYPHYVSALGPGAVEDQHLAGVLMWFTSSMVYAATVVVLVARWIASTVDVNDAATPASPPPLPPTTADVDAGRR